MEGKKTILYLGLNDQQTQKQKIRTKKAFKIINNLLLNTYLLEGATIQTSKGIYKHKNGKIVIENTIIIILLDLEDEKINAIIKDLKNMFNQECILKETNAINYDFI
jgi:hypothetical protein